MTKSNPKQRVTEIKRELSNLGPLHPGSVSEQYNICGTPGCHCKDPKNYKRMQELVKEWVDLEMEMERRERAQAKKK
jgi:hypothetical protein